MSALAFELPGQLEAHEPPEARGLARDDVRMLVASRHDGRIAHASFRDLLAFLAPGDLLVVNTSATLPAALPAVRHDGAALELHLSTPAPHRPGDRWWIVELRLPSPTGAVPFHDLSVGEELVLPGSATMEILAPYAGGARLWLARLDLGGPVEPYLHRYGLPIRYGYVQREWPLEAYQNVWSAEPGSAEMPSAGRPFTAELVTRLVAAGVQVAPVTLHTGVSSPERRGRTGDRGRDDRRARARDDGDSRRNRWARHRLDEPRHNAGARPLDGRRPSYRLARGRGIAPAAPAGRRRGGSARPLVPCGTRAPVPLARVRRRPSAVALTGRVLQIRDTALALGERDLARADGVVQLVLDLIHLLGVRPRLGPEVALVRRMAA